jgi:Bacteriophage Mu Gam like protein
MPIADEWDSLDLYLAGGDPADDGAAEPDRLYLNGQADADTALRRLARVDRTARDVKAVADAERHRIDAWEADRLSGLRSRREWLIDGLEGFLRAVSARSGTLSLSLPWGHLSLRQAPTSVEVLDPAAVAAAVPDLAEPQWKVSKADVKRALTVGPEVEPGVHAALTSDGEVVPGVVFRVEQTRRFYADPREGSA